MLRQDMLGTSVQGTCNVSVITYRENSPQPRRAIKQTMEMLAARARCQGPKQIQRGLSVDVPRGH